MRAIRAAETVANTDGDNYGEDITHLDTDARTDSDPDGSADFYEYTYPDKHKRTDGNRETYG